VPPASHDNCHNCQLINFYLPVSCFKSVPRLYSGTSGGGGEMMTIRRLRHSLVGLLMLAMAMPAATVHVCRCAHRIDRNHRAGGCCAKLASVPLRACCLKKLAKAGASSPQTSLRAKCCCNEVRWSQAVAKLSAPRPSLPEFDSVPFFAEGAAFVSGDSTGHVASPAGKTVRAAPAVTVHSLLCRWQV
jgi:hypothetical protein